VNSSKRAFIQLLLEAGALQFGEFTLKSGRVSPYFFNIGRFRTGAQVARLGEFFAEAVLQAAPHATIVFGPAYKGIPLCLATAIALNARHNWDVGYLFDRKEAKTHGDVGRFVGSLPGSDDRIVLVDDVITDGQTKYDAVAMLRETFAAPIDALVIAFNRMERDAQGRDALHEFQHKTGIPVHSLLSVAELEEAMEKGPAGGMPAGGDFNQIRERLRDYRSRYGLGSRA
jgi:orotate phosphoribosyltransferase